MVKKPFQNSAAFYDVDGTLIKTNIVHSFAYYARNQPTLPGSLWKTAQTALSVPLFAIAERLKHLGSDASRLSQLQDGKWKVVSDYFK